MSLFNPTGASVAQTQAPMASKHRIYIVCKCCQLKINGFFFKKCIDLIKNIHTEIANGVGFACN